MPRRSGDWWLVTSHSQLRIPSHQSLIPAFKLLAAASPPQKEANPASLRSAAPSKGRGLRGYTLLPMEGGAPKGRRLDGGKQDERSEGRSFQLRRLRQYPNTAQRLLSGHCPKRGKEGSARRFAWPLISPKILIKVLAMDPLLCYNTINAGMARLF